MECVLRAWQYRSKSRHADVFLNTLLASHRMHPRSCLVLQEKNFLQVIDFATAIVVSVDDL